MDLIDNDEVNEALGDTELGGRVYHLRSVDSTNRLALDAAAGGEDAGAWIADEQTAGRGRGGHTWHSAPGEGLYVSVLLTPRVAAPEVLQLSLAAGLAAQEAIEQVAGITVDLRWPNDLVTYGREPTRKLGGILVETALAQTPTTKNLLRFAVIGIGINVSHRAFPAELAVLASSLALEGWRTPSRQTLSIALLRRLCSNVRELESSVHKEPSGEVGVIARLERSSTWIRGKRVRVGEGEGYTGVTVGLDANGFLRVEADDGTLRTVRSGGVREA